MHEIGVRSKIQNPNKSSHVFTDQKIVAVIYLKIMSNTMNLDHLCTMREMHELVKLINDVYIKRLEKQKQKLEDQKQIVEALERKCEESEKKMRDVKIEMERAEKSLAVIYVESDEDEEEKKKEVVESTEQQMPPQEKMLVVGTTTKEHRHYYYYGHKIHL